MRFWGLLPKGSHSSAVDSVTQSFPFLCGRVTKLQGARFLLEGLSKLLHEVWLRHLADINTRVPLCLCEVEFLWLHPDLTTHQGVVSITVRTVVWACVENILDSSTPDQNQIQLVPVLWAWLSPGNLVLRFGAEEGVVMHRPWKVHSSSSRCPFSFILPTAKWPRQEGHESWSAPTLALKSPERTTCSSLGMFLMMDARFRSCPLCLVWWTVLEHTCWLGWLSLWWS